MRDTQEVRELWDLLDNIDSQIADLKRQREQLDEWFQEANIERMQILRDLSHNGVEVEYA